MKVFLHSTLVVLFLCAIQFVAMSAAEPLPFIASIFSNNMVLQRDTPVEIWGWWDVAKLGKFEGVRVTVFRGDTRSWTTSRELDSDGRWFTKIRPQPAGTDYFIEVQQLPITSSNPIYVFDNVAFGDVYLCGGQSNMQFTVNMSYNGSAEVAAANYSDIRIYSVSMDYSDVPYINVQGNPGVGRGTWQPVTPSVIGGPEWNFFSGACYFFGRDLFLALNSSVPIGLLSSNYGGTIIEGWMTPEWIALCPNTTNQSSRGRIGYAARDEELPLSDVLETAAPVPTAPFCPASWQLPLQNKPTIEYNAMIYPIRNYTIRAVYWWQAEQNANVPERYACLFPAFVQNWRRLWANSHGPLGVDDPLPIFFVIMEPFPEGCTFELIRMAQLSALSLPRVYYTNAIDIGDVASPYTPIHPRDKQLVGRRTAAAVMTEIYGSNATEYSWTGPLQILTSLKPTTVREVMVPQRRSAAQVGNSRTFYLEVHFTSKGGSPLSLQGTQQCWICCNASGPGPMWISSSETITPTNKIMTYNTTVVGGDQMSVGFYVDLPFPRVPQLVALNFESYPQCGIYDAAGFPAPPFISSLY